MERNPPVDILVSALRYKLCALPIGVSILPTFAPIVIKVTTRIACFSAFAIIKTEIAKGTKVTSATSLVISIAEKNVRDIRTRTNPRSVLTLLRRFAPMLLKTPIRWNPQTTIIKQTS